MAGTATVTFFHHSGFSVAVGKTLLIFDYWRGQDGALPDAAQLKNEDFQGYDAVLVFVSHDHEDHFDDVIYSWDDRRLPISYIISSDLPLGKRGKRVNPGDVFQERNAEIRVFDSTDKGVSFYVTVDGLHIFHAGDLNLWHWRDESTLREIAQAEKAFKAAMTPLEGLPVDIAMFPVDPRMGGYYDAGANYYIMSVKPRLFIPMHWQGRAEVASTYARKGRTKYTEVLALTKPRERAELIFDGPELHIHVFTTTLDANAGKNSDVKLDAYVPGDPFFGTDLPVKL